MSSLVEKERLLLIKDFDCKASFSQVSLGYNTVSKNTTGNKNKKRKDEI